jgi:ribosomal protein S18 acetylase RimI-like enzyme
MSEVTLRVAILDDSVLLLDTIVQAFEMYRNKFDPPSGVFTETVATIRAKLEIGGGYIATINNVIVGCVLYEPQADHIYLGRLAVLPAYRGNGVARVLVEAVENRARELSLPAVQLGVRIALTGNQEMFTRLGYQVLYEGRHPGYNEITFVQMEKRLIKIP